MLAGASHAHKVNFCKFTNETRNGIEDLSEHSGLKSICAINGTAAGGGYELALATDYIMLVDDGSAAVSLPELPLLAVLPGTGGLTRVSDKRKVRRDLADVFCTTEEGVKGKRAVEWRLVDAVAPGSKFEETDRCPRQGFCCAVAAHGEGPWHQANSRSPARLPPTASNTARSRSNSRARSASPRSPCAARRRRRRRRPTPWWRRARISGRSSSRASLTTRSCISGINELDTAAIVFKSAGDPAQVLAYDAFLDANKDHWLAREIRHLWKRVLKRVDLTSRSLVTLIEPGSCFAGTLAELPLGQRPRLHADRTARRRQQAGGHYGARDVNFGAYPMSNGLTRLACRFLATPENVEAAKAARGKMLDAEAAQELGLVTFALDDIDWDDEVRVFLEERASFSPDGLTGLEANLRFAGPETMESKIFARLTAWQNWIFQRPNAIGEEGALKRYGTGQKPVFDTKRV